MAHLHVRDIDDNLFRRLKALAAMQGKDLKVLVPEILAEAIPRLEKKQKEKAEKPG